MRRGRRDPPSRGRRPWRGLSLLNTREHRDLKNLSVRFPCASRLQIALPVNVHTCQQRLAELPAGAWHRITSCAGAIAGLSCAGDRAQLPYDVAAQVARLCPQLQEVCWRAAPPAYATASGASFAFFEPIVRSLASLASLSTTLTWLDISVDLCCIAGQAAGAGTLLGRLTALRSLEVRLVGSCPDASALMPAALAGAAGLTRMLVNTEELGTGTRICISPLPPGLCCLEIAQPRRGGTMMPLPRPADVGTALTRLATRAR